ncbi:MAG: PTS sugar transporter subunit IIA [Longicatena sp.]
MKDLSKRHLELLKILRSEEVMTSQELGMKLHVSSKTIRNEIKVLNSLFSTPCIIANKGSGYSIVKDHEVYNSLAQNHKDVELHRNFKVLKYLLTNTSVNFYDLAEALYISETTLQNSIVELNEIIAKRNISVQIRRTNNEVYFDGSEEARRQASTYFLMHEINDYNFDLNNYTHFFHTFDLTKLKHYILTFDRDHDVKMIDFDTISFVMHVAIMLERILQGNEILPVENAKPDDRHMELAKEFAKGLVEVIDVALSNTELSYLACLFAGKLPVIDTEELADMRLFIDDIIAQIQTNYDVDLNHDLEFRNNFLIHLMGLKNRIDNQTFLNNPLIADIKQNFVLVYDISVFIAMKIQERFDTSLLEDEIGYITLHLMGSLVRMHTSSCRRVVVLSPLGEAGNGYLRSKLTNVHDLTIELCAILSMFDTKKIAEIQPDLIISFFKEPSDVKYPVYVCDGLLSDGDLEKIYQILKKQNHTDDASNFFSQQLFFPNVQANKKEEVIQLLCDTLYEQGYVEKDYQNYVLKREQTAPTAYGNMFAIPHPIEKKANKNMVAVAILNKPIIWSEQKVRLVFLFSLSKERDEAFDKLFEQLVGLLNDENKVKQLIKMDTFTSFITTFMSSI